jgi:hypothetical protein
VSDATLAVVGDDFIDLLARTYPSIATMLGIHEYDGELGSYIPSAMTEFGSELRLLRDRARAIDAASLSAAGRIDQKFLLQQVDSGLLESEGTQWWRRNPDQALDLLLTGLFFLVVREFAPAEERARSLEARLRRLPPYLQESRAALGDTPPVLVEIAAQTADGGADFLTGMVPEWASSLGRSGAAVLDAAADGARAMREHAAWLRTEYLPRCNAADGVGEDLLDRVIKTHHLLGDSPDEIARRGEEMIERLNAEIEDVAGALGFASWRAAVHDVKKDVPTPDELIGAYRDAMRWTEQMVREHDLATVLDDAPLEVRETPAFWRHTTPYAAYSMPGPFDRDQQGIFWVTPPDGDMEKLKGHSRPSITVVALHEGYPGHHLQLTRANRHPSKLRRLAESSMLAEGWAFYCEEMGYEQGLLSTESRLCQLKDEIWRAYRVVIDMRLHQRRMTPAEAVEMLVREADLERPNAESEVRRYTYTPGYQMSYAIGKQEIMRLREQVVAREGADFSLKRFHDRVLDEGSLPTPLIAEALLHDGA